MALRSLVIMTGLLNTAHQNEIGWLCLRHLGSFVQQFRGRLVLTKVECFMVVSGTDADFGTYGLLCCYLRCRGK